MAKSIISNEKSCFICGDPNVVKHHSFHGTANRQISESQGCWIYLCPEHHNMSNEGVHFNHPFDVMLKKYTQMIWEEKNGKSREDFIKTFGKSHL